MIEQSTTSVIVSVLPGKKSEAPKNSGDVEFEVKYPEGYTGPKFMPEGPVIISKESAEIFTKRGIGKIITPAASEEAKEVVSEVPVKEEEKAEETPAAEEGAEESEAGSSNVNEPADEATPAASEEAKPKSGKGKNK